MEYISQELLNHPVMGLNLRGETLRDELPAGQPTLVVFLRHFGCIFCREQIADLRKITAADPNYPPVLFVYQGSVEQGRDFFGRLWPEARAIADTPKTLYDGFGVACGGMKEMFGPEVWACGVKTFVTKGHFIGMKVGDPWTMPTSFLVDGDRVLWMYEGEHVGDHPEFERVPQLANIAYNGA
ncbi:MAG: SelL-related redox protein [Chloroflexota bacterium]